ncbi:MAG: hypothetical protein VX028_02940 [Nanoarchaeota archaeon]|nr:hypothetical protein [Nanoarchaeota archaeon]MEC8339331.1 hypothetical protein [Nanoarchaeota archaeon]
MLEDKALEYYKKRIDQVYSKDLDLQLVLSSYLEMDDLEINSLEGVFSLISNYYQRLQSYKQLDIIPPHLKKEYESLRLLRMEMINGKVSYNDLVNHIMTSKK